MKSGTLRKTVGVLAVLAIASLLLIPANLLGPFVYSLTDGRPYKQQAANIVEPGTIIRSIDVGDTPTSIDILKGKTQHLALVTSMGDSSISVVDLAKGELSRLYLPTGSKPRVSVWCDINNDGREEVVVPLWGDDQSSIFVGEIGEDYRIENHAEYTVGVRPRSVVCADIDSDDLNDIISADNFSDTISILRNVDGHLVLTKSIQVASDPGSVSSADFNRDGRNDIVVAHRGADNAYLLVQSDGGEFQHALTFPTTDDPKDQVIVDIDNDGDLDLVTVDGGSNTVSLFYMEDMDISVIKRIKVSGTPHAVKYLPIEGARGAIVVASYPNWIEVLRTCGGEYELDESYWYGGLIKQKILYLDFDPSEPEHIYSVMAGTNSVAKSEILKSNCN